MVQLSEDDQFAPSYRPEGVRFLPDTFKVRDSSPECPPKRRKSLLEQNQKRSQLFFGVIGIPLSQFQCLA